MTAAKAELNGFPVSPSFSSAEQAVIARNALLSEKVTKAPWLVRRILDLINSSSDRKNANKRDFVMPSRNPHSAAPQEELIDPVSNPDLSNFDRSSTEAAYDLFKLLKEAGEPLPMPKSK